MKNESIPCGLDDDRCRLEPDNLDHARAIDDYVDVLIDECKQFESAAWLNLENDLYDGDLLPRLMVEVANWTGSIKSSHKLMKAMYNLLSDELQKIAEMECK